MPNAVLNYNTAKLLIFLNLTLKYGNLLSIITKFSIEIPELVIAYKQHENS